MRSPAVAERPGMLPVNRGRSLARQLVVTSVVVTHAQFELLDLLWSFALLIRVDWSRCRCRSEMGTTRCGNGVAG
jgi:hypothetical protein